MSKFKKIAFAGGGTGGSATPLLAIHDQLKNENSSLEFVWFGTTKGPEKGLVTPKQILYRSLVTAKLDRFLSLRNLIMPFKFLFAFMQSFVLLKKESPSILVAAGSFVTVPLIWVAWLMRIPVLTHQLDIRPTLSNKLTSPFVKKITVTYQKSLEDFPKRKTVWTGSPVRESILNPKQFNWQLNSKRPVVLIVGGGTGAMGINQLVYKGLEELTKVAEIIHITGKGKGSELKQEGYHRFEFLRAKMGDAYSLAEVVVSRAGIGTINELAALKKPSIIIPLPNSHQVENSEMLKNTQAALVLDQEQLSPQIFTEEIAKLLADEPKQRQFAENIGQLYRKDAVGLIIEEIKKILYSQNPK